jgi:hypothetical protein
MLQLKRNLQKATAATSARKTLYFGDLFPPMLSPVPLAQASLWEKKSHPN